MKAFIPLVSALALGLAACNSEPAETVAPPPLDGTWQLDPDASRVNFTTTKVGQVAEAHDFGKLSGTVAPDGEASVAIDLASVNTNIDLRDQRMEDVLFDVAQFPQATVSVQVDPASLAGLAIGESVIQDLPLTLELHGNTSEIPASLVITRIGLDRVLVETAKPLIVSAASVGLEEGVEQLRELAGLDSIAGQVPVTVSLTFEREQSE